jgi:hypothetical protein
MGNNYKHGNYPQRAYFKLHLACTRDFKLTPGVKWDFRSSGMSHRSLDCLTLANGTNRFSRNVGNYQSTLRNVCRDVDCVWNVMAHAQKPDLVFLRNGRVHLNRRGRQFSRLLAAEVCASAFVMLDTPCSEVAWEYWLPTPFASFPFTSPPVRHRVPSGFNWTIPTILDGIPQVNERGPGLWFHQ